MLVYDDFIPGSSPLFNGIGQIPDNDGYVTHPPVLAANNPYFLGFTATGQQPIYYSKKISLTDATALVITNGQYTNLTVKMAPPGTINGRVIVSGGATDLPANSKLEIKIWDDATLEYIGKKTILGPASGVYSITVPQGTYRVQFDYYSNKNNTYPTKTGYYQPFFNATSIADAEPVILNTSNVFNINYTFVAYDPLTCVVDNYSLGAATTNSVNVSFQTTCPSQLSRVSYSTIPGVVQGSTNGLINGTQDHNITVTGLTPNTTYYLKLYFTVIAGGGAQEEHWYNGIITGWVASKAPIEIAARTAADGKVWYFAAGNTMTTTTNTVEKLHILNSHDTQTANITIAYYGTGGLLSSVNTSVGPKRRIDRDVNTDLPAGVEHSTIVTVTSGPDVLVERTLYTERQYGLSVNGGYTIAGSPGPNNTWYFPTVNTADLNYFTVFNPNVITACFNVTYYKDATGGTETKSAQVVPPMSRFRFSPSDTGYVRSANMSAIYGMAVVSTDVGCPSASAKVPVLVEQEVYVFSPYPRKGATGKFGIPSLQSNWLFSDGRNKAVDSQFYTFLNTNPVLPATVTIIYQAENPPAGFNPIFATVHFYNQSKEKGIKATGIGIE
jgi:hypothetical protein